MMKTCCARLKAYCDNMWYYRFLIALVSVLAVAIRVINLDWVSGDWMDCLEPWIEGLGQGGWETLTTYPGNYNMPYVTVLWIIAHLPINPMWGVKIFSCFFDFVCAYALGRIVILASECDKYHRVSFLVTYALALLSPITIGNGARWGQCDAVYSGFVLLALLTLMKEKYVVSMVFWGAALAFKLQAILAFPFLILFYVKNKRFSCILFFLIPIVVEILCVPAIVAGCSPWVTLETYLFQTEQYPLMFHFYPNLWGMLKEIPYWVFGKIAIVGTVGVLALICLYVVNKEQVLDKSNVVPYFTWMLMSTLMFLPSMHERYGFLLELVIIAYAVLNPRKWFLALLVQSITIVYYLPMYLARWVELDSRLMSALYILTYFILTVSVLERKPRRVVC